MPTGDREVDEEFETMASEARNRKVEKKKRMKDKANQFLPEIEEEVHGQRGKGLGGCAALAIVVEYHDYFPRDDPP